MQYCACFGLRVGSDLVKHRIVFATVADITGPRGMSDHTAAGPAVRTGDEPATIETIEVASCLAALGERAKLRVRRD